MTDRPRVLVTGAGGPSGISILRDLADEPLDLIAADIDPFAAGLYLVDAPRRAILPRGDDAGFCDALLEICRAESVSIVVPTVDSELLPLALDRERYAGSGVRLVLASEETLRTCLDKWVLAERCRDAVRVPDTWVVDDGFDAAAPDLPVIVKPRSGSGSRGIRLVERREELEALERDGTLLVQENLPGTEYSLDVIAREDGHVAGVVPARTAEGRLRHRGHRAHAARRAPRHVRPRGGPAHRPDHGRQRPGQGGRRRRPRPARGQRALPRHDAADDRRGRRHAEAGDRRGARHADRRTVRCRSRTSRWSASSRSASSRSTTSPTCSATRRASRAEPARWRARPSTRTCRCTRRSPTAPTRSRRTSRRPRRRA